MVSKNAVIANRHDIAFRRIVELENQPMEPNGQTRKLDRRKQQQLRRNEKYSGVSLEAVWHLRPFERCNKPSFLAGLENGPTSAATNPVQNQSGC